MNYAFLLAFGFFCVAMALIMWHPTARICALVVAGVMFAIAAEMALFGEGVLLGH